MRIRPEIPDDVERIRAIHLAAFPGPDEADLVDRIRASDGFVPGLSLIAEDDSASDGPAFGHILFSRLALEGTDVLVLGLAPMGVVPDRQRQGIGSALVRVGLDACEALEEPLVVVLGHPWFYPRFGFRPASRYGILPPRPWPDSAFMAKPLTRWSRHLRGRVVYPPTFDGL